jgi:Ca2+-binding RTX toxin-like protein
MTRGIGWTLGVGASGFVAAAVALALWAPGAHAVSATCLSGEGFGGSMLEADPGETNRVIGASRAGLQQQALKVRGTDPMGNPVSFENICFSIDAEFHVATIALGNRGDVGRADGKGAGMIEGQSYKAVHPDVVVTILGGAGRDLVVGHRGDGTLRGDAGRDRLKDLGGNDVIDGGAGPDRIKAKDGAPDIILCDRGDTVRADPSDTTRGC